ncbi:hypothetical protein K1719_046419 [Acacia pycnantha]|nr:hypothetical protein K1719_046419 [Acacia pycnantha]
MGATWYGIWAPSSSNLEVGNQVHQDDPVNEAVSDAFGVQDDNFTREVRDADIPSSFYEAKKIINEIRLELRKNRCCPSICMLYWGEDDRRRLVRSVTLRGSRLFGKGRSEEETAKILRYFPLKPLCKDCLCRLRRLGI